MAVLFVVLLFTGALSMLAKRLSGTLVTDALAHLTFSSLAIIFLSLFVVRPIAIWISLIGTDVSPMTRVFFGWFGPGGQLVRRQAFGYRRLPRN